MSFIPSYAMRTAIILAALASCANAAYYIIDIVPGANGAFSFWGTLRYDADNYSGRKKECVQEGGIRINRGDLGGFYKICPDSNLEMGLYFPHGYNGTISEAYDNHNKLFYPCVKINTENPAYACGDVIEYDLPPQ
ncbi:unnamed protein product [Mortierella alpina]